MLSRAIPRRRAVFIKPARVTSSGITVSPTADKLITRSVAPTVVLGSLSITASAQKLITRSAQPTVVLGSISIAPSPQKLVARSAQPGVVLGSITLSLGSQRLLTRTTIPTVIIAGGGGGLTVNAAPSRLIARALTVAVYAPSFGIVQQGTTQVPHGYPLPYIAGRTINKMK